jgi:mono/diheme cytochrome c family protein
MSFVVCAVMVLVFATGSTAQEHVGQFSQSDVENGFRLYGANCTTCHGDNGDGVPGIDLRRGQFRRASSDVDLTRIIANGIPVKHGFGPDNH